MKMVLPVVMVVIFVGAGHSLGGGPDDLKRMQGTWQAVILEAAGVPTTEKDRAKFDIILVIKDNKYDVYFDRKKVSEGVIKLTTNKKPGWVDAIPSVGPEKGKAQLGIYVFEGNDMKVSSASAGSKRPTSFKTKAKSTETLILYKRIGK